MESNSMDKNGEGYQVLLSNGNIVRKITVYSNSAYEEELCPLLKEKPHFEKWLTLCLLMTTQGAFVDSIDQGQTAQKVQSDL